MKILLDAGHGGTDPGATVETDTQTIRECDITLAVVKRMEERLKEEHPDWDIRLSRMDDVYMSPGARARLIQKLKVDAAVSVHCNSSSSRKATGHEVVYREDSDYGLASAINAEMCLKLPLRDRGLKNDVADLGRKLALMNTPGIPTVIVEPGFISNETDLDVLLDYDTMAEVLSDGVTRWAQEYA